MVVMWRKEAPSVLVLVGLVLASVASARYVKCKVCQRAVFLFRKKVTKCALLD